MRVASAKHESPNQDRPWAAISGMVVGVQLPSVLAAWPQGSGTCAPGAWEGSSSVSARGSSGCRDLPSIDADMMRCPRLPGQDKDNKE